MTPYKSTTGQASRWVNRERGRYYIAIVAPDLFGGWHLTRYWGSLEGRRGGAMSEYYSDWRVIEEALWRIGGRRRQHGYLLIP